LPDARNGHDPRRWADHTPDEGRPQRVPKRREASPMSFVRSRSRPDFALPPFSSSASFALRPVPQWKRDPAVSEVCRGLGAWPPFAASPISAPHRVSQPFARHAGGVSAIPHQLRWWELRLTSTVETCGAEFRFHYRRHGTSLQMHLLLPAQPPSRCAASSLDTLCLSCGQRALSRRSEARASMTRSRSASLGHRGRAT